MEKKDLYQVNSFAVQLNFKNNSIKINEQIPEDLSTLIFQPNLLKFIEKLNYASISKKNDSLLVEKKDIFDFFLTNNKFLFENKIKIYFINIDSKFISNETTILNFFYSSIPKIKRISDSIYKNVSMISIESLNENLELASKRNKSGSFLVIDFSNLSNFKKIYFVILNTIYEILNQFLKLKEVLVTYDSKIIFIYDDTKNNLNNFHIYYDLVTKMEYYFDIVFEFNFFYGKFSNFDFNKNYEIEKLANIYSIKDNIPIEFWSNYKKNSFYKKVENDTKINISNFKESSILTKEYRDDKETIEIYYDIEEEILFQIAIINPTEAYRLFVSLIQRANNYISVFKQILISVPIWYWTFVQNITYLNESIVINFKNEFLNSYNKYFNNYFKTLNRSHFKIINNIAIEYSFNDFISNEYYSYGFKNILFRKNNFDYNTFTKEQQFKWNFINIKINALETKAIFI